MTWAASALAVTLLCLPGVHLMLRRAGLVDVPNHRSSHTVAVVRGGGLACAFGLSVTWATQSGGPRPTGAVIAAALALGALGLADDIRDLPAPFRLVIQVVVGAAGGALVAGAPGAALGAAAMAIAVNTVNFMDGIDGLTGISMAVWGAAMWWTASMHGVDAVGILGALTFGCALGFLPANLPVARMFLGDTGSYLFGGLVGGTTVLAISQQIPPGLVLAPALVLITDVGATVASRALRGERLMEAHRDHTYQRLARVTGVSHAAVALLVGSLSLLLVVIWAVWPPTVALGCSVTLLGLYVAAPALVQDRLHRPVG